MLDQLDACPVIQIDQIDDALFRSAGVAVRAARLDLIDASINGNKWYKLCCNLQQARKLGIRRLLSFGGAWSNHLHALAAAGARFGFETIGIVRGEPSRGLTPTLADAQGFGMRLHFVDRSEYRRRDDADYVQRLAQRFAPCLVIPEGGGNQAGVAGCEVLGETSTMSYAHQQPAVQPADWLADWVLISACTPSAYCMRLTRYVRC
jgi:1-aminocyclopropane-1-carboxylate deaminase